jgi:hypothetical protein
VSAITATNDTASLPPKPMKRVRLLLDHLGRRADDQRVEAGHRAAGVDEQERAAGRAPAAASRSVVAIIASVGATT